MTSSFDVPPWAQTVLANEPVRWIGAPVRRAGGGFVWLIALSGGVFLAGALAALAEIAAGFGRAVHVSSYVLLVVAALLAAAFALFSAMMMLWPALSTRVMKRTVVAVTATDVVRIIGPLLGQQRAPRVKRWPVLQCNAPSVTQRRGPDSASSATLVLNERVIERKRDGQMLYRWDALIGLADADGALRAVLEAQAEQRAAILA